MSRALRPKGHCNRLNAIFELPAHQRVRLLVFFLWGLRMLLGGFIVLFLGLAFIFFGLSQGLSASPACTPVSVTVWSAFASQIERTSAAEIIFSGVESLPVAFGYVRTIVFLTIWGAVREKFVSLLLVPRGSVGIGTTSPGSLLDVGGNANVRGTTYLGSQGGANLAADAGYGYIRGATGIAFQNAGATSTYSIINTNGGNSYFNSAGGNVGIVFTSPLSPKSAASIPASTKAAKQTSSRRSKRNQKPIFFRNLSCCRAVLVTHLAPGA